MKEVKDIWQFFENMNEYVYATDIETHEIVYMNRKTLQVYGLQSLEDAKGKMGIFVAVDDLKYLKKGGRISSSVALVGGMLKVKPILKFDIGTLDSFKNCRGLIKAKTVMIEEVKRIVTTDYAEDFEKGNVHILAASSADEEETKKWVNEIQEAFPGIKVLWDYLPMGITCHIGPGGLGIGYSVRP